MEHFVESEELDQAGSEIYAQFSTLSCVTACNYQLVKVHSVRFQMIL